MAHLIHLLTCLIAIYVGLRTLLIWTRTRKLPELAIGTSVLALALGGAVFAVIGASYAPSGEAPPRALVAFGILAVLAHIVAAYVGSWRIYRPASRAALWLAVLGSALASVWAYSAMTSGSPSVARSALFLSTRGVAMCWAAFEAFRYASMLRRRIAFGLADPMMAHRFWLWGVGASAQTIVIGVDLLMWIGTGGGLDGFAAGVHMTAAFGLVGTTAIALAFFPPRRYRAFIERAGQPAGAASLMGD